MCNRSETGKRTVVRDLAALDAANSALVAAQSVLALPKNRWYVKEYETLAVALLNVKKAEEKYNESVVELRERNEKLLEILDENNLDHAFNNSKSRANAWRNTANNMAVLQTCADSELNFNFKSKK
jgi:hypothetical protein